MKPTLVILAAGMGSRYGGLKQLDEVGPNGEAIIDYSLYDAIRAGFGKVVFVIRTDFAEDFKARFEPNLKGRIETEYVYQSLDKIPEGSVAPILQKTLKPGLNPILKAGLKPNTFTSRLIKYLKDLSFTLVERNRGEPAMQQ